MKTTLTWINISDKMPKEKKWVLVSVPFCRAKICAGLWNGIEWKDDEHRTIHNVNFWSEPKLPE